MDKPVLYPHPALRTMSVPVTPGKEVNDLIKRMIECMYAHEGLGLAANQLGVPWQVLVMRKGEGDEIALLNPKLTNWTHRTSTEREGCLSIPGLWRKVTRPHSVRLKATLPDGSEFKTQWSGLMGRCFSHELDHLHGKLFIDRLEGKEKDGVEEYLKNMSAGWTDAMTAEADEEVGRLMKVMLP